MYKRVDGKVVEMTPEEITEMEQMAAELPLAEQTQEERIAALEKQNEMLIDCILELSELVYG